MFRWLRNLSSKEAPAPLAVAHDSFSLDGPGIAEVIKFGGSNAKR